MVYNSVLVLLALVAVVATKLAYDYVTSYLVSVRHTQMYKVARAAVSAAEQMFENNDERLDFALGVMKRWFPNVDTVVVRAIVEAAVFELNERIEMIDQLGGLE